VRAREGRGGRVGGGEGVVKEKESERERIGEKQ